MANIKFNVSKSGITEDFLIRIWEAQSDGPGGHVDETTLVEKDSGGTPTPGAGHQVVETVEFIGRDTVTHIIRIYGVTSGQLWNEWIQDTETNTVNIYLPIQFKISDGGTNTPAADQDTAVTPELIGFTPDQFIINRNNYGMLKEGTHFDFDSSTGTWVLEPGNSSGDIFNDQEEFTIIRLPQVITTVVNDSVVGKDFGGFFNITANVDYDPAHLRKLRRFTGAFAYTFPLATTIPIGYAHCFQNFGVSGTGVINFNNGTLLWGSSPKNTIDIPPYCEACFIWDGTNWNVKYLVDTSFANAPSVPNGTIIKAGTQAQGDIPAGDPLILITHNADITGDYILDVSFMNNNPADYGRNNKICWSWHHHPTDKPNKVYLTPQEISSEVQNVTICYTLIKV